MHQSLRTALLQANLRQEEVAVYLLLLKLKKATLPQLQQQSDLINMMVYRMIRSLVEKELISAEPINEKQSLYRPLSLQSLLRQLEKDQNRLRRLEQKLSDLNRLLPGITEDISEKVVEE